MESHKNRRSNYTRMGLNQATAAEILRSHQKDNDFIEQLQEKLTNVLHSFGKNRFLLYILRSRIPAALIYFIFTSGMGNQTLGEEYTGIVQANLKAYKAPPLTARILALILEWFGERALFRGIAALRSTVNDPSNKLTPSAIAFLNSFLSKLQFMIPILVIINKGLFYIRGKYYSISKRLTGINYAKVYGTRPTDNISWGLRLLGAVTLAQCALKIWQSTFPQEANEEENINLTKTSIRQSCQLCIEAIPTTATPCGHIFCWPCISNWLRAKARCPLCRERVAPSRIVRLMNL